jgi:hypothetical protein
MIKHLLAGALAMAWAGVSNGDEEKPNLQTRFNVIAYGEARGVKEESPLNPGNRLKLQRYLAGTEFRLDLDLDLDRWEVSFKPRGRAEWSHWREARPSIPYGFQWEAQEDRDFDLFVNEWTLRYRCTDRLFLGYGRRILQWGPSHLLSVSNPFIQDNGKANPLRELPGSDYGTAVWLPSDRVTVSMMANTDEGRLKPAKGFERAYALKFDYTGDEKYFSLIPSKREGDPASLGFFGLLNASEALLIYGDGQISKEVKETQVLLGGSYTFWEGTTLALEYYHNGKGCGSKPIRECASVGPPSREQGLSFIRENYIMAEYFKNGIIDRINLTLRWVEDLDEHSSWLLGILEYDLNDHTQCYGIGSLFGGYDDTELGGLFDYAFLVGVSYTF